MEVWGNGVSRRADFAILGRASLWREALSLSPPRRPALPVPHSLCSLYHDLTAMAKPSGAWSQGPAKTHIPQKLAQARQPPPFQTHAFKDRLSC